MFRLSSAVALNLTDQCTSITVDEIHLKKSLQLNLWLILEEWKAHNLISKNVLS